MPQFEFTEEEFKHIQRAVKKLTEIRKDLSAKDWKKPQNSLVKELANKFPADSTHERSFILNRNCIKAILQLTKAGLTALNGATIPAYKERIASQPDKKEFYQPYLEKAERMATVFEGLTTKLEGGL